MEADRVVLILPRHRAVSQEVFKVMIMLRKDHMGALESGFMWQAHLSIDTNDDDGVRLDN